MLILRPNVELNFSEKNILIPVINNIIIINYVYKVYISNLFISKKSARCIINTFMKLSFRFYKFLNFKLKLAFFDKT